MVKNEYSMEKVGLCFQLVCDCVCVLYYLWAFCNDISWLNYKVLTYESVFLFLLRFIHRLLKHNTGTIHHSNRFLSPPQIIIS